MRDHSNPPVEEGFEFKWSDAKQEWRKIDVLKTKAGRQRLADGKRVNLT